MSLVASDVRRAGAESFMRKYSNVCLQGLTDLVVREPRRDAVDLKRPTGNEKSNCIELLPNAAVKLASRQHRKKDSAPATVDFTRKVLNAAVGLANPFPDVAVRLNAGAAAMRWIELYMGENSLFIVNLHLEVGAITKTDRARERVEFIVGNSN